jgi:phosphopantothenoylcysteine decarboxylase/phosphopantothenate--cysteine ligase
VANDVSHEGGVMGGSDNTVHLVRPQQVESWDTMSKQEVARKLMERFAALYQAGS